VKTKIYIILFIFLNGDINLAQEYRSPYPIIFVHGLNSFEGTWDETINFLSPAFGGKQIFHAVLNAYTYTRLEGTDMILGNNDDDVLFPKLDTNGDSVNQLQNGSLFVINFKNFWNENTNDPRIIRYDHGSPGFNESDGNESAIYKQGYVLKKSIEKVREVTSADKVILVGHSMGGLAIREYLQRIDENGKKKWWVDTSDNSSGHKVAKVVTIGTPHGGSDAWAELAAPLGVNLFSEAVRDLRATLNNGNINGIYLFGGNENTNMIAYYNYDVNCNGNSNDHIAGISEIYEDFGGIYHLIPSTSMQLPQNISYIWIISDDEAFPGGDGVVDLSRQWLYNSDKVPVPLALADTLLTNKFHTNEPKDYKSIIRGLDEPNSVDLAYEIGINDRIKGFITYPSKYSISLDVDLYKIVLENDGNLNVTISGSDYSGVNYLALYDSTGMNLALNSQSITNLPAAINYPVSPSTYYIMVRGSATNNSFGFPYTLTTSFQKLNLISPNNFETVTADSIFNIEWISDNIQNLKLELTTDNGLSWTSIISSVSASSGSYFWIVPRSLSDQCKIRISDTSNPEVYRESTESFAIIAPPIRIIEPNGFEDWSANSLKTISWDLCNADSIKLELTTDNGSTWITITQSTPASSLEYNWTVINLLSNTCRIKITDLDNPTDNDLSDNLFTISGQNFWSTDPNLANPICIAYWQQLDQKIVSDDSGGAIIVWADGRTGSWDDIYAQKINSKGTIQWALNGNSIRSKQGLFYPSNDLAAVSDGNGGAIVAWSEAYSPGGYLTYHYIKAQKIDAFGNLLWNSEGVPICMASIDRKNVNLASDGNGGAIITWADNRNGNWDIFAQRVSSSGSALWYSEGIVISSSINDQDRPTIISDGKGGAFIKWEDYQSDNVSIYAQRINPSGELLWSASGIIVCSLTVSNSQGAAPPMISDSSGGVLLAWVDIRNDMKVYAQRIDSSGFILWAEGGVPVGVANYHANPQMVGIPNGGIIITWVYGYNNVKVQKVHASGNVQWETNGLTLYDGFVIASEIVSDFNGGAIIIYYKHISYNSSPYSSLAAKRIDSNSIVYWTNEFNTSRGPTNPKAISDNMGGSIITFLGREETGSAYDIYASKINANGELGGDNIPLPVELISFSGKAKGSHIYLNWSTATEVNNYGFEIERKTENTDWIKVGFVAGNGNSNSPKEYSFNDKPLFGKVFKYRLKQIDTDGKFAYSSEIEVQPGISVKFSVSQNFPNPFNPTTRIEFTIPSDNKVEVKVYSVLGTEIATLLNEYKEAGSYSIDFSASNLVSGVYLYRITSGKYSEIKKMILLR